MTCRSQTQFGSSEGASGIVLLLSATLLHVCLVFGYPQRPGVAFLFAPPLWLSLGFLQKPNESLL